MLIDGIDLQEGSDARNLTVKGGTSDPSVTPNDGELFYRSDLPEFRVRIGGVWEGMATITALSNHTHVLEDLTDVILGSPPTLNDILIFDGTNWINGPQPSIAWGTITGTLSNQTDLQAALDTKVDQTVFNSHVSGSPLVHTAADIVNVPTGSPGISATDVQGALDELNLEKEPVFSKNTGFNLNLGTTAGTVSEGNHLHTGVYEPANTNIQSHISDVTTNPHAVTKALVGLGNVDNTSDINKPISTLTQAALDGKSDVSHNHPANVIVNTPAGNISATDVQAAINELDTEKVNLAGDTMTGLLTLSADPTANLHAATKQYVDNNFASLTSTNVFTQSQTISSATPELWLIETDTVDQSYRLQVSAGICFIRQYTDTGTFVGTHLIVRPDSKELDLTSTDITYDGQSIARVGTANIFTQNQDINKDFPILTLQDTTGSANAQVKFQDASNNDRGIFEYSENTSTPGNSFTQFKALQAGSGVARSQMIAYEDGRLSLVNAVNASSLTISANGAVALTSATNQNVSLNPVGTGVADVNGDPIATLGNANTFTQPQTLAKPSGFGWILDATTTGEHRAFSAARSSTTQWEFRLGAAEEFKLLRADAGILIQASQTADTLNMVSGDIAYNGSSLIVPAASETVQGKVELATQAEVDAGTDTTRVLTPSTFANSSLLGAGGGLIDRQVYTASGTWTKPANIVYAIVTVVGAGGAGAGATGTATTVRVGGSGGAGGAIQAKILAADLTATETVTVATWTAGGAGNLGGTSGSASSFGTIGDTTQLSANGGNGGSASVSSNKAGNSGGGGLATAQTSFVDVIKINGQGGSEGHINAGADGQTGAGGNAGFGLGLGGANIQIDISFSQNGSNGTGYGAGGSGAISASTTARTGGAGTGGIVIVESYA